MEAVKQKKKGKKKKKESTSWFLESQDPKEQNACTKDAAAKTSVRQEENAETGTSSPTTQDEKSVAEDENVYETGGSKNELETSFNSTKQQEQTEQETDASTGECSAHVDQGEVGTEKHKPESATVESLEPEAINSTQSNLTESSRILENTETVVNEVSNSGKSEKSEKIPVETDIGKTEKGSQSDTVCQTIETNVEKTEPLSPVLYNDTDIQAATQSAVDQSSRSNLRAVNQTEILENPKLTTVSYPQLDSLIEQSASTIHRYKATLQPFSEDTLHTLYFNPLLVQLEGFIDHFIQISKQEGHEFYELVNAYYRARNALAIALQEYEVVAKQCEQKKEEVWIIKDHMIAAQGKCQDHVTVSKNYPYQQVELNVLVPGKIESLLKMMQKALHETLCLQMYTSQLARLHIDIYIYELVTKAAVLSTIPPGCSVTGHCPVDMSPDVQDDLQKLRECISVLFMFVRQPIQDELFVQHLNQWLEQLVAVLLRVASLADLVFLLNHIMRCPAGFASKVAHFVQFPVPSFHGDAYHSYMSNEPFFWDNPLVHHFVATLAVILNPTRERESFLQRLDVLKKGTMRSISWMLVDEDGEEEEEAENSWALLQESDLVAIFLQFPFDAIFRHLLKIDPAVKNEYLTEASYSLEYTTSRDVMRMIAFATCVVRIMGNAFTTYQRVRYRAFVKRIGRTIRQVVQFVLDHWSNYRSWRVNVCGDTEHTVPDVYPNEQQFTLARLQVEVDHFFLRATQQILSAHRLGAWQFLADMPFTSVSTSMVWKLFFTLHSNINNIHTLASSDHPCDGEDVDWKALIAEHHGEFVDQLVHMSESEAVFLMTTFANMAGSRESKESEFIEAVALEVYEVSYVASETREFCSKNGRDLLSTIAAVHPFVLSVLLKRVAETVETVGKACVYLFNGLPVYLWSPLTTDMDHIRTWLLKNPLTAPEHQLARYILANLNWGYDGEPGETDKLFLNKSWHRAAAILLVEVCALRLPNSPGGISHEAFKDDGSLLQQVTQIAASSYSKLVQQSEEQSLGAWLWEVTLSLRLHDGDMPTPALGAAGPNDGEDNLQASDDVAAVGFGGLVQALSCTRPLDMYTDKVLSHVSRAVKARGPLACYVAVAMTTVGSSSDMFLGDGLNHLTTIVHEKCYDAAFRVVSNVVPLFFTSADRLHQEQKFVKALHHLTQLDTINAGYTEKLLQYNTTGDNCKRLAGIIQSHVDKFQVPGTIGPQGVLEFWLKALFTLPLWYRDTCIQFLLDNVMKSALRIDGGLPVVQTELMEAYRVILKESGGQGILSSILSLVSLSSTGPPVLWDVKNDPDYSYYAYCVLCLEDQLEVNSGFRTEMSKRLLKKSSVTVDRALKKVTRHMKLTWSPQPSRLTIYRWANQSLATGMDHPILPLIWQRFFTLYLDRPSTEPGLPQRAGVGFRYFDSPSHVTLLKKMKQRLQATADHHRTSASQIKAERDSVSNGDADISKQFDHVCSFHEKLAGYYQTLALWLDEPRLHDPELYLPSLPSPYDPDRLQKLMAANREPWFEFVDLKTLDWELRDSANLWTTKAFGSKKVSSPQRHSAPMDSRMAETAAGRIIRRIKSHQAPLSPPPVPQLQAPIPPLTDNFVCNKQKVLNTVYGHLQTMVTYARKFCSQMSHHVALDIDYIELLPTMNSNENKQVTVDVPCRSKFGHQCIGPARLTLKFMAMQENEVVKRKIDENRQEYNKVVQEFLQPCSLELCRSAAFIENIIILLVKIAKGPPNRATLELVCDTGAGMFYQMAGAMDDNVLRFYPTTQFFSSCVEMLGKEFISTNANQMEQLLSTILEHTSITGLLVPHFCPNDNPAEFTNLYHRVLSSEDKDLCFALLTKFDLNKWLSTPSSTLIERSGLTAAVFHSLCSCGFEPSNDVRPVLEVYLRHLSLVLTYNFPEQYSESLRLLCEGSSDRKLCLDVWNTFLECIGCVISSPGTASPVPTAYLGEEQIRETLDWLTKYVRSQRAELGVHVTGSLYTMWRPYINMLSHYLGFLCQQLIVRRSTLVFGNGVVGLEKELESLWKLICGTFEPWISPLQSPVPGNNAVPPWNETEVPQASDMVALFTDTIGCLHLHLPASHSGRSVMNLFWPFFACDLASDGIPPYVSRVYHSKFFLLPWVEFYPTLPNMDLMVELQSRCSDSFVFLGCVFPLINWTNVITAYCQSQTTEAVAKLHCCLFQLLLMFGIEKGVMEVSETEMPALLERAQSFPWSYLDARSFDKALQWMIDKCDSCLILQPNSTIWHSIRFIRAAAGISSANESGPSVQAGTQELVVKRTSYVRSVVTLLSKSSSNTKLRSLEYPPVLDYLLRDVEYAAGTGVDPFATSSEVCFLMSEILNLLNNCSPVSDVSSVVLEHLLHYLSDTSCTILITQSVPAACRSLANITYMVRVLETVIDSFFVKHTSKSAPVPAEGADRSWGQLVPGFSVPELAQDEFVQECLKETCLLTLYTHVLQKLSQCESPAQEMTILTDLVDWCTKLKPSPNAQENEYKMLLLWHKIMQLANRQADFPGTQLNRVVKQLTFLASRLHALAEDKESSGLLGAIGWGKKSPFSSKFRFLCRVLEAFLLAQMPSNSLLRLQPKDPGYVREPKKSKQLGPGGRPITATGEAEHALTNLDALRNNKHYSAFSFKIIDMHAFVSNPLHSLRDAPRLVTQLARDLFPEHRALDIMQ